ncbi:ABC1 kinase family protein [Streptomyces sp. URMC 129]|uniref:ABC1 kinase family protein n=1 Tax=Streptomyces sp. URMC 129 TaxID=3423407 RepID=UPI003F1B7DC1
MSAARARLLARVAGGLVLREVTDGRVSGPAASGAGSAPGPGERRAIALREAFERLGPLYIKVGQILSTRPDLVSGAVIKELEKLHDRAAALPFEAMEPVLEAELGPAWRSAFSTFDTVRPLGSASLAQVYAAVLPGGEPVVVKVQRPGIRPLMDADMRMLRRAARVVARGAPRLNATMDVEATLAVVLEAMRPELDFRLEARNMDAVRPLTREYRRISVPRVVLATPRVLVQTRAAGVLIRDADHRDFAEKERLAIGRELLSFCYRGYFREQFFHADPHPGNILVHPALGASVIDWGMVGRVDRGTSMGLTLILIAIAENDGAAAAKAWIEMGKPTPWADTAGFIADIGVLVPRITRASLEELNFGTTLAAAIRHSSRRGIQTSPMVSILGKSFANIDGSVRCLAPEISVTDVFRSEMRGLLLHFAHEFLSEGQVARAALETIIGARNGPAEARQVLRDLAGGGLRLQASPPGRAGTPLRGGDPRTTRLLALAAAALVWRAHRRGGEGRGCHGGAG